ncbi:MAG: hypothetical protein RLZZ502_310, partial [Pseudomonadota bacterium]
MVGQQQFFVCSRKGLFVYSGQAQDPASFQIIAHHFAGEPVTQVLADTRAGGVVWYVALRLGHFGVKMKRSHDQGKTWVEIPAPALPEKPNTGFWENDPSPWSVDQVWSLATGGVGNTRIWAGCSPAGLFYSDDLG